MFTAQIVPDSVLRILAITAKEDNLACFAIRAPWMYAFKLSTGHQVEENDFSASVSTGMGGGAVIQTDPSWELGGKYPIPTGVPTDASYWTTGVSFLNRWHHVVATYSAGGELILYINGIPRGYPKASVD